MSFDVRIIVAAHKKYRMPEDPMYLPVHVGAEGKDFDLGYQKDNEGENISSLNPSFCELTGLYWAWKNLDADHIGLVHYRRYFRGKGKGKDLFDKILKYEELKPVLDAHPVIVPNKRHYYIETLYKHYQHNHYIDELDTAADILKEKYPSYAGAYDKAINRTWGYMFNMMIMRKDLLDDYCTWLFDILFELSERLKKEGQTGFEARFPGRVSERLFNVWLTYKLDSGEIKEEEVMEIPFMYMEKINIFNKGITFLKAKFLGRKPEKSF
ncbi:MAG: DUF4422 domain-containing protein [Clostridiales bacterium]|nr:DUF4422 domain-containing protein [Clostridiales bacterium]